MWKERNSVGRPISILMYVKNEDGISRLMESRHPQGKKPLATNNVFFFFFFLVLEQKSLLVFVVAHVEQPGLAWRILNTFLSGSNLSECCIRWANGEEWNGNGKSNGTQANEHTHESIQPEDSPSTSVYPSQSERVSLRTQTNPSDGWAILSGLGYSWHWIDNNGWKITNSDNSMEMIIIYTAWCNFAWTPGLHYSMPRCCEH